MNFKNLKTKADLLANLLFKRTKKVILTKGSESNKKAVIALMGDLAELGYQLDQNTLDVAKTLTNRELRELHSFLTVELSRDLGAYVDFVPLFLKFPDDIPSHEEYFHKRMVGFYKTFIYDNFSLEKAKTLSCGCVVSSLFDYELFGACPVCQFQSDELIVNEYNRNELKEPIVLKNIGLGSLNEAETLLKNILNSKVSFSSESKTQVKEIITFLKNDVIGYLPTTGFLNKENLATVYSLLFDHTTIDLNQFNLKFTATDILRIAVAFSNGDVSLKNKTKFSLNNRQRKFILSSLEKIGTQAKKEDMLRYSTEWIFLGKYLHVGSMFNKYPSTVNAFKALRNNPQTIVTYKRKIHKTVLNVLQTKKVSESDLSLFKQRPGEFARILDLLLRETHDEQILVEFEKEINKIATPLLIKLAKYIGTRTESSEFRTFIPKGNIANMYYLEKDNRKPISKDLAGKAEKLINSEVKRRFSKKEALSKVFIDPKLKSLLVPFSQRSTTKTLNTIERGSKIKLLDSTQTLRMFLYWHENAKSGRLDVDLSAVGYSSNWEMIDHLSFRNIKGKQISGVHSGDIQSAPHGASEFVDINLKKTLNNDIRYIVMNVHCFSGPMFSNFECFAGFMERQVSTIGKIYEPKTVQNKFDLSSNSKTNIPLIIDLVNREVIWADISLDDANHRNVVSDNKIISQIGKMTLQLDKNNVNLFELFSLHAQARGAVIHTEKKENEKYDYEFGLDQAKNIADILSNWIS